MKQWAVFLCIFLLFFSVSGLHADGVVDIVPTDDAQVVEGYPSANYGDKTYLYVNSASGGSYLDERSWLKFDLSGEIPANATITSAKLRLYCWKTDSADDMWTSVHGSTDDSWIESTITWSGANGQPAFGAELSRVLLRPEDRYSWFEWDVAGFVNGAGGQDDRVSLVVKPVTEGQSTWRTYAFDAKEYENVSLAPRLRVEYSGGWTPGTGFKIFHMNDAHSRLLPHDLDVPETDDVPMFEKVGGAAYFATRMLALKTADANSLILDAGDISEGNPLGDLRGNGGLIDFYNLLDSKLESLGGRGIDAVVVGNHDVRSLQMLNNMKNNTNFPCISMNVCHKGTQTPYFDPHVLVSINGVTVGVLGYTTDTSSHLGPDTDPIIEVVKCVWDDEDPDTINIKDKVQYLRTTENCDVVVLLSHVGHSRICAGDDALIRDTGGVQPPDVVIAGHWHTLAERVWQPAQLNGKTLIAEAGSYLQYIGELEVTDRGKYVQAQKHAIRCAQITPDPDVENLIATLTTEFNATSPPYRLDQVIGYSAVDLRMDKDKWWTLNEFPWSAGNTAGAWVCDSMQWKTVQLGYTCDLALQSGGGIRRDVKAGPVTYAEIYETYPWQDDDIVRIQITGQEIWDFIQGDYCGTSLSKDWAVHANDGIITQIYYQGNPINSTGTYQVVVSAYMYEHETWSDTTPENLSFSIRQSVVDYTSRFDEGNPMTVPGPRYALDTELAGGFRAVVTMISDAETQPYFEAAFIRLLAATPETVQRRGRYGLAGLVHADGSINPGHQFSETMWYRSHLGFRDGFLKPGDIVEIWGEGGFHDGNAQLVDQSGIQENGAEFKVVGSDPSLAQPAFYGAISDFWDEWHENHYVKFYAEKTGNNTVRDPGGTQITVYKPGGYYTRTLPGNVGDTLELTGVQTFRKDQRRFRCHTVSVAGGYPPYSSIDAITPYHQPASPLALSVTAGDADNTAPASVEFFYRYSRDGLAWNAWTSAGTDTVAPWAKNFTFPEGYGHYEFYSVGTDADSNMEEDPVRADTRVLYCDGVNDAPAPPADPGIPDGTTDIGDYARLSVTVSDPDLEFVDVYFYAVTDQGDVLVGQVSGVATGHGATVDWTGLQNGRTYQWYAVVDDGVNASQSPVWSFHTTGWVPPVSVPATGTTALVMGFGMLLVLLFFNLIPLNFRRNRVE